MSDLLAKCDWNGDELRVELPQWPEAVNVWVDGKAMPYVPVVNDSKCDTCEAMLDCDECQRADASHKELRGLQAENDELREKVEANGKPGLGGDSVKALLDKLRAFTADPRFGVVSREQHAETINAIADAIETEYQKAEDEWKAKDGQTWLRGYAECHAELMEGNEVIAADLKKAGWVRGPLDADGETWHVGDEIANEYNHHLTVSEITYKGNGCWMLHAEPNRNFYANIARHHRPPTVEDVLMEFADEVRRCCDTADTIAEYAAKLRLAGEDE